MKGRVRGLENGRAKTNVSAHPGRPRRRRPVGLFIYLTYDERDRVNRMAADRGVTVAALVRAALGLIVLAGGCARVVSNTREPRPCQAAAVDLVWRVVLGRADRAPDVWWVPPANQTCGRVVDGARGFPALVMGADGRMVAGCAGASAEGTALVNLVWYGAWERTGLAHEFVHVIDARDGRPPDMGHTGPPFAPGGVVERANARLAAARLCAP